MRKFLLISSFLFLLSPAFSQNTTYAQNEPIVVRGSKALIIPFSPQLFITNIGKELCAANNISFDELKDRFRSAMDRNIFISLKDSSFSPVSFYNMPKENARKEETYIYSSIGYVYKDMPAADMVVEKGGLVGRLKHLSFHKKQKTEQQNAGIKNGQLANPAPDHNEKFMQVKITNPNLLKTLEKSYGTKYFIFISEIDINKAANNAYPNENQKLNEREIKVHYTIFNVSGSIIASGAKKTWFSDNTNNINQIFRNNLGILAQNIIKEMIHAKKGKSHDSRKNKNNKPTTRQPQSGNSDFTKP